MSLQFSRQQKIIMAVAVGTAVLVAGYKFITGNGSQRQNQDRTLAIIKPDGFFKKEEIKTRITREQLTVRNIRRTNLTRGQAQLFFNEKKEHNQLFNAITKHMTSGPIEVMVLEGRDAVRKWKEIMGNENPKVAREEDKIKKQRDSAYEGSIRGTFGSDIVKNVVYGSDSPNHASREIKFFFDTFEDDDN